MLPGTMIIRFGKTPTSILRSILYIEIQRLKTIKHRYSDGYEGEMLEMNSDSWLVTPLRRKRSYLTVARFYDIVLERKPRRSFVNIGKAQKNAFLFVLLFLDSGFTLIRLFRVIFLICTIFNIVNSLKTSYTP